MTTRLTDAELNDAILGQEYLLILNCNADRKVFLSEDGIADDDEPANPRLLSALLELKQLRAAIELAADDELFFGYDQEHGIVPVLLLSDTFAYATADGERIEWTEIPAMRDKVRAEGWPAAVKWVAEKRKLAPLKPLQDRMDAIAKMEAELKQLRAERDELSELLNSKLASVKRTTVGRLMSTPQTERCSCILLDADDLLKLVRLLAPTEERNEG